MITRSKRMSDFAELRASLEEIKKIYIATNDKIDLLLTKIAEKDKKIDDLQARLELLEGKNAIYENTIALLERKVDDNESYHRRLCLRIVGMPQSANGTK